MNFDAVKSRIQQLVSSGTPLGQAEATALQEFGISGATYNQWVASAQRAQVMTSPVSETIAAGGFAAPIPLLASNLGGTAVLASGAAEVALAKKLAERAAESSGFSADISSFLGAPPPPPKPQTSQAALDTLRRMTTGMQIPGTAPIPGTAGPPTAGAPSQGDEILAFMASLGFTPIPGQPGLFIDLDGKPVTYDDVVSGRYAGGDSGGGGGGGAGAALGYAQLGESARQFDQQFAEDVRQFGADEAYRRDQMRQQGGQFKEDIQFRKGEATGFVDGAPTLARERFGEDTRQFNTSFGENQVQFDTELAERARQANLQSATSAFGDVTRVAPQMGQLALNNADFTRQVLSSAPDYLARAFFQQGQDSPLPQVSQADLINKLAGDIANYNNTLQGLNPQVGAFQPAVRAPAPTTMAPPAAAPTGSPTDSFRGITTNDPLPTEPRTWAGDQDRWQQDASGAWSSPIDLGALRESRDVPAMADGGKASGVAVVGEKGPELVIEMPKGFMVLNQKQLGFNPKTLMGAGVKGAQGGGLFGFEIPKIPSPSQTTQNELMSLERSVRPPSINTIFGGGMASSPRFGFDLFTPQQIRSLTPESRQALGTTLGTQFNETLENVGFAQEQRFGGKRANPRAAQLAGFGSF